MPDALTLEDLAQMPLERCVWSAALRDVQGRLGAVGGIEAKDRAAAGGGLSPPKASPSDE